MILFKGFIRPQNEFQNHKIEKKMEKNGTVKNGRVAAKIKRKVKSSKMTNCRKIKQL